MDSAACIYMFVRMYVMITAKEKEAMKLRGSKGTWKDLEREDKRELEGGKGIRKIKKLYFNYNFKEIDG